MNIDIEPGPGVDRVMDARKLDYPDGSADEVYASDVLEHFGWEETLAVLREWHRVLKPGGELVIKTPNLFTIATRLLRRQDPEETLALVRKVYGGHASGGDYHKAGFTPELLEALLRQAGFQQVRVRKEMDAGDWSNMAVRAVK